VTPTRERAKRVAKIGVSVALFVVAVMVIGPHRIIDAISDASLTSLLGAGTLVVVSTGLLLFRWIVMTRTEVPAPVARHVRIYLYANFLNSFTPGNVGGDVYRLARLRVDARRPAAPLECVLRERVLGLLAYLVGLTLAVPTWAMSGGRVPRAFWIASACSAAAALAILLMPRAISPVLRHRSLNERPRFRRAIEFVQRVSVLSHGSRPGVLTLLSMLSWAAWVSAVTVVGHGLGLALPWPAVATVATLTELVRLVPLTFQGVGVRESAFAALAALSGSSTGAGFATATVAYLLLSLTLLLSGPLSWVTSLFQTSLSNEFRDTGQVPPGSTESNASRT
jgi:uncharacterized protein (TIRG00374 family)